MQSYDISVDTQSNFAYNEYYLHVLVAFLINPYIEYGTGSKTKKLHKSPCIFDITGYIQHTL